MRRFLDGLYKAGGAVAAVCLIIILLIIVGQMVARWLGISFPGSTAYAGYFMAASSFLAFAYALNADSHIRVNLLLTALGKRRHWAELWCLVIGTLASCWMAYHSCRFVYWSHKLHEVSQDRDVTPLWIPQLTMAAGAILLAICFIDNLVTFLLTKRDNIDGRKYSGGVEV